jgi:ABC-type dipeptide/oligopeptide/nickel transport system ATPase component
MNPSVANLLSVRLTADYPGKPGALREVAFEIAPGEILGLVGQSGSGKSTAALAIMRLLDPKRVTVSGDIRFQGRDLMACGEREMRRIRGREIALVLQSPVSALNPAMRIGAQFREAWRAHADSAAGMDQCVRRSLDDMGMPSSDGFLKRYPGEMSVGQAQRVLIALATLHQPSLIIADEPTSALDVISQAEVLKYLSRLNQKAGTAILFISHDLLSIASICHRIAVLHNGELIEHAPADAILSRPRHPYTRQLIAAIPGWAAGNLPGARSA